jgi:hypothetical protein
LQGGINFVTTVKDKEPKLDLDAVKAVCAEYRQVPEQGRRKTTRQEVAH